MLPQVIQIGINYTITWGHGGIHAQAWTAVGLWLYCARVCANIHSSWYQWRPCNARGLGCHLGPPCRSEGPMQSPWAIVTSGLKRLLRTILPQLGSIPMSMARGTMIHHCPLLPQGRMWPRVDHVLNHELKYKCLAELAPPCAGPGITDPNYPDMRKLGELLPLPQPSPHTRESCSWPPHHGPGRQEDPRVLW